MTSAIFVCVCISKKLTPCNLPEMVQIKENVPTSACTRHFCPKINMTRLAPCNALANFQVGEFQFYWTIFSCHVSEIRFLITC